MVFTLKRRYKGRIMGESKSHKERILEHLKKHGSITSMEAIEKYGNTRLAATINNLRAMGYDITTVMHRRENRYGKPVRYGVYTLNNCDKE